MIEATAPLIDNGIVIGYIMFGQITDIESDEKLLDMIQDTLNVNHITIAEPLDALSDIERKSTEQIYATAKILEACTFYVLLKRLILSHRKNFADNLSSYLIEHISEELTVDKISAQFGISRSKLYAECEKYIGVGIAQFIKNLRLEKAKKLLKETDLTVSLIATEVGFSDYDYFCRVFKQEVGIPAKKYRTLFI